MAARAFRRLKGEAEPGPQAIPGVESSASGAERGGTGDHRCPAPDLTLGSLGIQQWSLSLWQLPKRVWPTQGACLPGLLRASCPRAPSLPGPLLPLPLMTPPFLRSLLKHLCVLLARDVPPGGRDEKPSLAAPTQPHSLDAALLSPPPFWPSWQVAPAREACLPPSC